MLHAKLCAVVMSSTRIKVNIALDCELRDARLTLG